MTAMTLPPFEPNAMPLSPGIRLLEASAGTGKTFTISALYLRLILGHGGDAARDDQVFCRIEDACGRINGGG